MALRYNILSSSGDFSATTSGNAINGSAIELGDGVRSKVKALSALLTVLAETNTITLTAKWQVSNGGSTWVDLANGSQNAAGVALATGTSGADTPVSKAIAAPEAIYGWRRARIAIVVGGTNGTANDTYAIGYCCRSTRSLDG